MDYHLHESFPEDWEADALLDCTPSTSGFRDDNATWVDTGTQKEGKRSSDSIWIIAVALLAINLVFVFSIYMELTRGPDPKSPAPLVYSPANEAVRPEVVRFQGELGAVNEFKGHRSTEMDQAWSNLYEVKPLVVTSEELRKANATSFEIPTRPGQHLVKLGVFHQLHCVDFLRKYIHKDDYVMDGSRSHVPMLEHLDHCIDMLRQAVACAADTTMIPFRWDGKGEAMPDFSNRHQCRELASIRRWAETREFDMEKEMKEHPHEYLKLWNKTMNHHHA